jgi:hypothetical protein
MKVLGLITLLLGLLALSACNKGGSAGGAVVTKAETAVVASATPAEATATVQPTELTLASGQTVKVIEVAALDNKPEQYAGQIAIVGKVESVLTEKEAFTLSDVKKMPGCADDCCSQSVIPMKVPQAEYQGRLPEASQEVIVVGNLTAVETGYTFDVTEVRRGEEVLLSRKAEGTGA